MHFFRSKKSKTPPTTNSPAFRSVEHLPSSVYPDPNRRSSVSTNEAVVPVPPIPHQHPAHAAVVHRSQSHRRPNNNNNSVASTTPPREDDQSWQSSEEPPENPRRSRRNLFSSHSASASSSPVIRESTGFLERSRSVRKTSPTPQNQNQSQNQSQNQHPHPHSHSASREYVGEEPLKSMPQEPSHSPPSIHRSNTDPTLLTKSHRPSPVDPRPSDFISPHHQLDPRPASRQSLGPPSPLRPLPNPDPHLDTMSDRSQQSHHQGSTATPPPTGQAPPNSNTTNNPNPNPSTSQDVTMRPAQSDGRTTPTANRIRDESDIDLRALVQKHDELQAKYSKVKRYYFEKEAQVQHLQNTVAHQRMAVSRTVLDDNEYANRFGRLDGAIKDLAFTFRKDWQSLPKWLRGFVNPDAHITGTKEMTATGRAVISRWLVDELFDCYFHPVLEPTFSRQLKSIEMNLRRQQGSTVTDEDKENAIARISNWRRTTLDGLSDALVGPAADEYRAQLINQLVEKLVTHLATHMGDPPPQGLDNCARIIVENAVGISEKIPLESRDVCVEYIPPGTVLHEPNMKVEPGLPPLAKSPDSLRPSYDQPDRLDADADDAESSGSASQDGTGPREQRMRSVFSSLMGRRPNPAASDSRPQTAMDERSLGPGRIRFASFISAEVRGRGPLNVLVKAPVYLMDS
ncbi:hypothetical protein BDV25DRAFT_86802 [Aspergillus avenaceus]|uniref:S-adenosylmethionine-dependent methyltransferase-like protein n=1 Tax=Aspergillus avenaceus TaxID=36643 RepID=A0A5N6TZN0_ASPAV|nr:hypothetical protein BDV25DRAFT_86802 [Aspergillus avenaceus]